ncbi:hypothetical protein VOLCADRAFT_94119 [Volvox carteri f. nagariensis]|uniref:Uncharacterized protein n=1 Tax=Volvox carteri f. nagariensis TaxID=3068 RepID=D8U3Y6_VOLCA|nr:uncharacterized protein VOLCADRAFT_94119 [Volvox carteri f. nagariensis]EFJ45613.1 hypothetical protein VOLCADRAFT_94119 [Volvox carteri f. nagariensis]|eukprot:XP_002953303.1 hypothetical protein VOLCADRAFT_94119 [Volvox carteri f. nagariensis]
MPGARPACPAFLQQLAERRRRVIGGMSCPGLRDECYACLYGCSQAGVLGPRDIEAAIMDTGGDAGRTLAWYPGLLMAWRFDKADTFFRDNQLPAYYGEIDSIRRQLINPQKMMMIGPYLISFPALRALSKRMPHVNISSQDLNYKDKQNQRATLK